MTEPTLRTPRGPYFLREVERTSDPAGGALLTLVLESREGLEKIAFRCRLTAAALAKLDEAQGEKKQPVLARSVETQFERLREAALKAIRSERRLLEVTFEESDGSLIFE